MSDLIVVKVKGIFEFLETVFNTTTKQIVGNYLLAEESMLFEQAAKSSGLIYILSLNKG